MAKGCAQQCKVNHSTPSSKQAVSEEQSWVVWVSLLSLVASPAEARVVLGPLSPHLTPQV